MTVDDSNHDVGIKLHDLRCLDAVARLGSFHAAARSLHRSHPSVFAAVGRLEGRLGVALLDRGGYRVALTEAGRALHAQAAVMLAEFARLTEQARILAVGNEPVVRVVIGDLCPRPTILGLLAAFFADVQGTRLHLDYEAVGGPAERLRAGAADIVFHRAEDAATFEQIALQEVALVPVAAPRFLPGHTDGDVTLEQLRPFTQCVIRDTASAKPAEDHFLIDGSPRCSVPDHAMKRDLILHGLAWGHLPDFMVAEDLRAGTLTRITGPQFAGRTETLSALRRRGGPHGPVAHRLWEYIGSRSPE